MVSEPRTLFVLINDSRLVMSEPECTLFHDQWFLRDKLVDQNMARRFIDQHVRGFYKDGSIHFYRCPTFVYDDQDISVMEKNLDKLLDQLLVLELINKGNEIKLIAGRGHTEKLIRILTVN